jgi:hypothetical protein
MTSVGIVAASMLFVTAVHPPLARQAAQPDFSGTSVEDVSARKTTLAAATARGKSMALPPGETVVRQTAATLTIEEGFMSRVIRYVYRLDGAESENHNGANTQTTKSAWDGRKLVTRGTSFSVTNQGESTWEYKEVRWLDTSGAMVTETTHKDEAGKVNVVTRVFRKKKS